MADHQGSPTGKNHGNDIEALGTEWLEDVLQSVIQETEQMEESRSFDFSEALDQ